MILKNLKIFSVKFLKNGEDNFFLKGLSLTIVNFGVNFNYVMIFIMIMNFDDS